MASSNTFHHSRSNSFPSRPHPVISRLEENLNSLRISSETTCSSSSSSSSLTRRLDGLQDLHDCVDELLSLHSTQMVHETWLDELLEGSLMLLDLCSVARNGITQTREALMDLHSSLRRGNGKASKAEFQKYLKVRSSVRKAMKKAVSISSLKSGKDDSAPSLVGLLREVEATTIASFESVFRFMSGSSGNSRSIISKLLLKKRVIASDEEKNELAEQDMAVESLITVHGPMKVEQLQKGLKDVEIDIRHLEDMLDIVYRRLIKSRVSLLNILNK